MHEHKSPTKFDYKAQFDTAANLSVLCARFEWYGRPLPTVPTQSTFFGSELYIEGQILEKIEETFRFADAHPSDNQLDHVMIYVFDGRGGVAKFHAHSWRPAMGRNLMQFRYFDPKDPNPYLPYIMDALCARSGAVRVDKVVNKAFGAVRKSKAAGLPEFLPAEAHKLFLRDTLIGLQHNDPFIHFKPSSSVKQPHVDRRSLVEHLGAYDLNPTWNTTETVFGRL